MGILEIVLLGIFLPLSGVVAAWALSHRRHGRKRPANDRPRAIVMGAVLGSVCVGDRERNANRRSQAGGFRAAPGLSVEESQHMRPGLTAAGCPECGAALPADFPEGMCPQCLLLGALSVAGPPGSGGSGPFTAPQPGDLAAHFPHLEILSLLGQGGMGAVYKARQVKLDRMVALKILPAEWGRDPAFAERFGREARALARLSHPHVVAVHDFGEAGGHFFLLMEFVDGANLRQLLQTGPVEPALALQIIPQICDALQYAHEEGVVHRDVKPENILLDKRGRVKMADFGLAKLVGQSRASFTLTGTHQVMGTLDYMAPEQRSRPQEVDHRADVYSLGVVIYEMLTGELPLGRFAPPSRVAAVDGRLDEVVFRALEREPEQRYQHASEVRDELEAIAHGPLGSAESPAAAWPGPHDAERRQLLVRGPAVVLLMTAVAAVLYWLVVGAVGTTDWFPRWFQRADTPDWLWGWLWFGYLPSLGSAALLALAGAALLALAGTIAFGASRLRRCEGYEWVIVAGILAALPWSPHFVLGLPAAVWSFAVLAKPEVRAAFAANLRRRQKPSGLSLTQPSEAPRPAGPVGRAVRSFLRSFRSLFVGSPGGSGRGSGEGARTC